MLLGISFQVSVWVYGLTLMWQRSIKSQIPLPDTPPGIEHETSRLKDLYPTLPIAPRPLNELLHQWALWDSDVAYMYIWGHVLSRAYRDRPKKDRPVFSVSFSCLVKSL